MKGRPDWMQFGRGGMDKGDRMSTTDSEPLTALAGQRVVEAGRGAPGDRLTLPGGRHALWLVEGEVTSDDGGASTVLAAGAILHHVKGPGTVALRQPTFFVWLDGGDPLGFGARAPAYRQFMESKNLSVGQALADGLDLRPRQIWVDIGTGTGVMVQALRERAAATGPRWIVGVDRAAPMLDEARRHGDAGVPAWLVADDVEHMAWPDAMLDGVTASCSCTWWTTCLACWPGCMGRAASFAGGRTRSKKPREAWASRSCGP